MPCFYSISIFLSVSISEDLSTKTTKQLKKQQQQVIIIDLVVAIDAIKREMCVTGVWCVFVCTEAGQGVVWLVVTVTDLTMLFLARSNTLMLLSLLPNKLSITTY